ncbi:MAG: hypothetical protein AAGA00_07735 [Pseudomonadota bacterium]
MRDRLAVLAIAGLISSMGTAHAADMEYQRELGLIVSGVVDKWAGVQFIEGPENFAIIGTSTDDTVFVTGGEALLSLPAGDNLSIQSDFKYEYNSNALDSLSPGDVIGPEYMFQGAFHLSWRDPTSYLFGFFGGVGESSNGEFNTSARFVGGEVQFYIDNLTFYAQGGYVDFAPQDTPFIGNVGLDDGIFARGVVRWFPTADSRLQLEGTYLNAEYSSGALVSFDDMEAFSVKARYDFTVAGLPILGALPVYVAYRGTFWNGCGESNIFASVDTDDHTVMVGTSYSFSGDKMTVDRQGATVDTPDFRHSCVASETIN